MPPGLVQATTPTEPKSAPRTPEILAVLVATIAVSYLVAIWVRPFVAASDYRILVSWASHVPQMAIPWVWYRWRVAPLLPAERRALFVWPAGSARLLWKIALWMIGLKFLGSLAEAWLSPTPQWVRGGFWPIVLILLYQGVFVGLSEEMMIRPALHQPLLFRLGGEIRLGRARLSRAWLMTSLLFGAFHLPNALLGQSVGATLAQAVMAAVVGGIIGYYYERTSNYLGAALLHGMLDVSSYLAFLLVLPLK